MKAGQGRHLADPHRERVTPPTGHLTSRDANYEPISHPQATTWDTAWRHVSGAGLYANVTSHEAVKGGTCGEVMGTGMNDEDASAAMTQVDAIINKINP